MGWKIYKKEARVGSFQFLTQFSKNDTSFIDANVEVGIRYEYYLTAVGFKNQESAPSDTAVYKLLNKAVSLGNTLSQLPVFEWHYSGVAPVLYILRLLENPANKPIWIARVHPGYQGQQETALYNFDGTAAMDSLQKNKTYAWRVDEIGSEASSGSESNWKVFTVPK
ncbi:MAG TPA: hypothetical protein ENH53_10355 [Bacteroidetes bacterium]|nr:hypothetical protein [Bacteroidota bacterium]HDZ12602.1 hypothetical protein [Bacteroidota bacterium]